VGLRSSQLHDIQAALRERDLFTRIDSVVDLKKLFPALKSRKLDTNGLAAVLAEIPTADLDAWQNPLRPPRKPQKLKKCLISKDEIKRLQESGLSYGKISKIAGVSKARIGQIVSE
jgi:hypothetical protein